MFVSLVSVDDMVIVSESSSAVRATKRSIIKEFNINDLRPSKYFLGIKFERFADGLSMKVTQDQYMERVLERFGIDKSSTVSKKMATNFLSISGDGPEDEEERKQVLKLPYRAVLGCSLYIAR